MPHKKSLFALSLIGLFVLSGCGGPKLDYSDFAKCLSEKNIEMYGTFWCPNCDRQKKKFGDAFDYVTYIECDPRGENSQSELCLKKGIEKYPTWTNPEGKQVIGDQTMEKLSEISGCNLPVN